ncbi:polysaccharide biosynthesis/export family protein [Qipengyuania sphaerica]|uniref:polysaccharide biosynthesis/export family protein n=1 Tax=Qipengyuania sphaerica TaxID=2867243 RepID=UPI001C883E9F|nr:polysaccharide biosynthesis/export family protein [Qipengyuania sphaerica]MBX7540054.1 polysaccharide export protein [Qipengyuania sphaerica]
MTQTLAKAAILRLSALLAFGLLAACQKPIDPVMPAGQAGYDAVAVDPVNLLPERYPLGPGDKISVRVYGETELSLSEIIIDNAGFVSLPLVGDLRAAGFTASELARNVEAAYAAEFLRDPQVNVSILEARKRTITVEGEVKVPGVFPYAEGQTLLTALALAQSPTERAKLDEVIVFRTIGGQQSAGRFDLRDIRGGRMPDLALVPGDVVVVGYSSVKSAYLDAVKALPVIGLFRPIT